jgi:hypothetical protein
VLLGVAPAGHVLRLKKSFATDTSQPAVKVQDKLDFTVTVPDSGFYNWHVNQSTRPLVGAAESYTLTCEAPGGQVKETRTVTIARGETQALDLACGGPLPDPPTPTPPSTPGQVLCPDARPPISSGTRRSLRLSRTRVAVSGRASDFGCRAGGGMLGRPGQLARVLVAVARRDGKACRFLRTSGTLSTRRSCSRALFLPATGLKSWSFKAAGTLPAGNYQVWTQSVDTAGNIERKRHRVLSAALR